MASEDRTWGKRRRERAAMAVVLVGLMLVPLAAAAWVTAFYFGAQGHVVGPDADEMAQDPVLHIDVANGSPGEIRTRTDEEGGLAPALGNSFSWAGRVWALKTADWQGTLVAAVEDVDDHQVSWWDLHCDHDSVVFRGRTVSWWGMSPYWRRCRSAWASSMVTIPCSESRSAATVSTALDAALLRSRNRW
jgi:hypothetical protein